MRAVLIDDEKYALAVLEERLRKFCPQVEIVGKASSAVEGQQMITELMPDLVFLDIVMPEQTGFDLLNQLPHLNFQLIFVTSFDEYAIQAIKFCAIGYITKPIRTEELLLAVNQAQKRFTEKSEFERNKQLLQNLVTPNSPTNRIGIPTERGLEFLETKDIVRCEGVQRCTKVIIDQRKSIISSYNIGEFVKLLETYNFYPVHKSHLVNLSHIIRYDNEGSLEMSDGDNIPVSRRRRQEFLEHLTRL